MKHETGDKGDIGVAKVISDLITKGFVVLTPVASTTPFDLVAYKDEKFFKVQVKYRKVYKGKISVDLRRAIVVGSKASYRRMKESECDVLAIYCPDTDGCYYVGRCEFDKSIALRVEKARNNQKKSIKVAFDYKSFPKGI